jgi:two-component system KDP operon response regulator KdpE
MVVTARPEPLAPWLGALQAAGFQVAVTDGLQGELSPDLAVVDLTADDGWPAAAFLADGRLIGVVDSPSALRRAFELGAEDCVHPDDHPDEVVARVEAVLRRTGSPSGAATEPVVYADRRLWVNFGSRQVWVAGRPAQLTPREFRLLQFFLRHRDQPLSHEDILTGVWGRPLEAGRPTEVLKQYIWRLRQKVEVDPEQPQTILTVPGVGYQFASLDEG